MPAMHRITTGDIEISYCIDGSGPETIVLVDGLADTKESWDAQLPALTSRHRVLSYDNRGAGACSMPPGPYTTAQMAEDLAALVDALGLDRFHVLGLYMGG